MSKKIDRKQLKDPDQFNQFFEHIFEYMAARRKRLIWFGTAVVIFAIAWVVVVQQGNKSFQERFERLYAAEKQYELELKEAEDKKNELDKKERESFLAKAPLSTDADKKSEEEAKLEDMAKKAFEESLKKKLADIKPSHDKSIKLFNEVIDKYQGKDVSISATFSVNKLLLIEKKYDQVVKNLLKLQRLSNLKGITQIMAYQNLGYAYEHLKDYKKALESFKQLTLLGKEKNPLYLQHSLHLGRLYSLNGDREKAKEIYNKIITSDGESTEAKLAKKLLLL